MEIDRRAFLASLGTAAVVEAMPSEALADALEQMPERPTLVDFFKLRFAPATHVLQSATDALKKGEKEEMVLACLLHDVVLNMIKVDHGWWGAQMIETY